MGQDIYKLFREYEEILFSQEFDPELLDYTILEKHIKQLERINVMQNSSISIFDLYRKTHVYISSRYESILGYEHDEFERDDTKHLMERIHPEDLEDLTRNGIGFFRIGISWPIENRHKLKEYKYVSDYRLMKKNGQYARVIEQHIVLELDPLGNVWLALGILDLSPDQDIVTPCRTRLINSSTGELFELPQLPGRDSSHSLSQREQEILGLIAKGLVSKEIADKLFISVNTVNTHRQNIIEKLGVKNSAEAVNYASRIGILQQISKI